jgi:hypothetical protein
MSGHAARGKPRATSGHRREVEKQVQAKRDAD